MGAVGLRDGGPRECPSPALAAVFAVRRLAGMARPALVVVRDKRPPVRALWQRVGAARRWAGNGVGASLELCAAGARAPRRRRAAVLGLSSRRGLVASSMTWPRRAIKRHGCRAVESGRSMWDSPVGRRKLLGLRPTVMGRDISRIDSRPSPLPGARCSRPRPARVSFEGSLETRRSGRGLSLGRRRPVGQSLSRPAARTAVALATKEPVLRPARRNALRPPLLARSDSASMLAVLADGVGVRPWGLWDV